MTASVALNGGGGLWDTFSLTAVPPGAAGNSITLAYTLSNFLWSATSLAGGANGQAALIGYNNLYSGTAGGAGDCGPTAATVKWAYNTGSAVTTSPVISLDGMGTTGSNGTSLVPVVPGTGNNAVDVQVNCGATGDARSSLFVDYIP